MMRRHHVLAHLVLAHKRMTAPLAPAFTEAQLLERTRRSAVRKKLQADLREANELFARVRHIASPEAAARLHDRIKGLEKRLRE